MLSFRKRARGKREKKPFHFASVIDTKKQALLKTVQRGNNESFMQSAQVVREFQTGRWVNPCRPALHPGLLPPPTKPVASGEEGEEGWRGGPCWEQVLAVRPYLCRVSPREPRAVCHPVIGSRRGWRNENTLPEIYLVEVQLGKRLNKGAFVLMLKCFS